MIRTALIKRGDIGSQAGLFFAFLFDRSDRGVARAGSLVARHPGFDCAINARRHIFNGHQHIQFEIGRFDFIGLRLRVKTVAQIIVLCVADLLQRICAHVMVRDHQAIRRHE